MARMQVALLVVLITSSLFALSPSPSMSEDNLTLFAPNRLLLKLRTDPTSPLSPSSTGDTSLDFLMHRFGVIAVFPLLALITAGPRSSVT